MACAIVVLLLLHACCVLEVAIGCTFTAVCMVPARFSTQQQVLCRVGALLLPSLSARCVNAVISMSHVACFTAQ
jgi:hypothetical protein